MTETTERSKKSNKSKKTFEKYGKNTTKGLRIKLDTITHPNKLRNT